MLSRQYVGDGVRYLPELTLPRPPFGMSKHVMFPALFWAITEVTGRVGLNSVLGHSFERPALLVICQSLNAFLGSLGVVGLYVWHRAAGGRRYVAFALSALLAFSNAYVLHATDMTEPIAAVPWLLGAAVLVQLYPERRVPVLIAGVLVGVAATFYIAAFLGCALVCGVAVTRYQRSRNGLEAILLASAATLAAVATYLLLFSVLSWGLRPEMHFGEALASTIHFSTDEGLYGSLNPKHLVGAVFGFSNAWAPLADFEGVSHLLATKPSVLLYNLVIAGLGVTAGLGLLLRGFRCRSEVLGGAPAADAIGSVIWLLAVFALAAFWSPTYEKLWLFGAIATLCFVSAVFDRPSTMASRWSWWPVALLAVLVACSLGRGIVPRRFEQNQELETAGTLVARLAETDLLVCPGWDQTSMYFKALSTPPRKCWSVVDNAIAAKFNATVFASELSVEVRSALKQRRQVFFLDLLDRGEGEWRPFYERRLGLPFGLLGEYRSLAIPGFHIPSSQGTSRTVFRYCGDLPCRKDATEP
jgi:hypothetical protein